MSRKRKIIDTETDLFTFGGEEVSSIADPTPKEVITPEIVINPPVVVSPKEKEVAPKKAPAKEAKVSSLTTCGHSPHWKDRLYTMTWDKKSGDYIRVYTEEVGCILCQKKQVGESYLVNPDMVIPVRMRRKETHPYAWPGLCTDDKGKYIGGIGNSCIYTPSYDAKGERVYCSVHNPKRKKTIPKEEAVDDHTS